MKGSLESDSGLKFSVHMELEGDRGEGTVKDGKVAQNFIDESFARVSGEFGQIEFGARDHVMVRMHSGISDVGIGLTSGDTQKWVPGTYLETAGHAIGNARKLNYISPRVSGLQLGVSYAPDDTAQDANTGAPSGNDNAGWGAGLNFQQEVGDMAVTFSLGHKSTDSAGAAISCPAWTHRRPATGGTTICVSQPPLTRRSQEGVGEVGVSGVHRQEEHGEDARGQYCKPNGRLALGGIVNAASWAGMAIMGATSSMTKGDASTYTNAGVGVSFGAFKFNVAYATSDGGAYTTARWRM